ncbi:MAG: hypothetical protein WCY48_08475 [Candidatus Caldatribacteriota bacterium]
MSKINLALTLVLVSALTSCSMFKQKKEPNPNLSAGVQTENKNQDAFETASKLAAGWPQSSIVAAKELITKYGNPTETTSDQLIWRNFAPFKEIIVHKNLYSSYFPLLHQNPVEHVIDYKASPDRISNVWNYNGSVVLNRTKGEMSAFGPNEEMNVLSMNLTHKIMTGEIDEDRAKVIHGQETLDFLNGEKTSLTQSLIFGSQINTADAGEPVTDKIRWATGSGIENFTKQAEEEDQDRYKRKERKQDKKQDKKSN